VTSDDCLTCRELSERAVGAIANHVRLTGKLEIAEIQMDHQAIEALSPVIAKAEMERARAVEEYRSHRNLHGEGAEVETAG
jgi:hypothetical protein